MDFKAKGEFPRYPEDMHLAVDIKSVDVDSALIVFISHWLVDWCFNLYCLIQYN